MVVKVDNTGSIDLASSWSASANTRHIDVRYHFVRNLITAGIIKLDFVASDDNYADAFTKNIDQSRFLSHMETLMNGGVNMHN